MWLMCVLLGLVLCGGGSGDDFIVCYCMFVIVCRFCF